MKRFHKNIIIMTTIVVIIISIFFVNAMIYKTEADNWYQLYLNVQKAQIDRDEEVADLKQEIDDLKDTVKQLNNK